MEDVLTEIPPPSRFFQEDLNNFAPPSPPIPSPFLVFSSSSAADLPLRPSLLIIAVSSPSLTLFHTVASKTLIGTLVLPETSFAGISAVDPSPKENSCNIYSLGDGCRNLLVAFQSPIAAERCHVAAKLLVSGGQIVPDRVLILDSVQNRNFRGKLARDEAVAFKLETTSEKKSKGGLNLEYLPSASVVDGVGAALLAQYEMKKIKAVLCVTWPEFGAAAASLIKSSVLPALDLGLSFRSDTNNDDYYGLVHYDKDPFDSDLYS